MAVPLSGGGGGLERPDHKGKNKTVFGTFGAEKKKFRLPFFFGYPILLSLSTYLVDTPPTHVNHLYETSVSSMNEKKNFR